MRILIVHNYYAQPGGERAAVSAQADLLRQHGHRLSNYTRDNAEIRELGISGRSLLLKSSHFSSRTYKDVTAIIHKDRPDIAHVHNVFPLISPSVYRALADAGVPIVQTLHNFRFMCPNGLFYTHGEVCERCKRGNTLHAVRLKCYRKSYPMSALYASIIGIHRVLGTFDLIDRFVALTDFVAEKLEESGITDRSKIRTQGNFLPSPLPALRSYDSTDASFVYLGRLTREKGVANLLAAASELPGAHIKIAGEGPMAEELEGITHDQGLTNVEFLGRVDGEAKWDLVSRAAAIVIPSLWYECFPIVALESLAVGTPVVASALGSMPSIIEDGISGLLYSPGDRTDLSSKLKWIKDHSHEAELVGRQGRTLVEQNYSADAHYEGLMRIYAEVTN